MTSTPPALSPPALRLLALEARVLAELPWFALRTLSTRRLPRCDGCAVMIVPGFGASDIETWPLQRALRALGARVCGWKLGRNLGMRSRIKLGLAQQLQELHARHGKVSLIGWSLGGVFVREMARHQPQAVRRVITLGSPINGRPDANNMEALFRLANRGKPAKPDLEGFMRRRTAPPVPCTALYSKSDGIVAWPCCLEENAPNTENIEVRGSHFGLVVNHQVLRVIAQRLAQDADRAA